MKIKLQYNQVFTNVILVRTYLFHLKKSFLFGTNSTRFVASNNKQVFMVLFIIVIKLEISKHECKKSTTCSKYFIL